MDYSDRLKEFNKILSMINDQYLLMIEEQEQKNEQLEMSMDLVEDPHLMSYNVMSSLEGGQNAAFFYSEAL